VEQEQEEALLQVGLLTGGGFGGSGGGGIGKTHKNQKVILATIKTC